MDSLNADLSLEDMVKSANFICSGSYVRSSDPMLIDPVNDADPQFFTDMFFTVSEAYKGSLVPADDEAPDSSLICVRQPGGGVSGYELKNSEALAPVEGNEYLLFLYTIDNGADYNTQGNHYYLIGSGRMGAWDRTGDGTFADMIDGDSASADEIRQIVSSLPPEDESPGPSETYRQQIEDQHDQGVLTEEQYRSIVDGLRQEDTTYARILSEEEAEAYVGAKMAKLQ